MLQNRCHFGRKCYIAFTRLPKNAYVSGTCVLDLSSSKHGQMSFTGGKKEKENHKIHLHSGLLDSNGFVWIWCDVGSAGLDFHEQPASEWVFAVPLWQDCYDICHVTTPLAALRPRLTWHQTSASSYCHGTQPTFQNLLQRTLVLTSEIIANGWCHWYHWASANIIAISAITSQCLVEQMSKFQ